MRNLITAILIFALSVLLIVSADVYACRKIDGIISTVKEIKDKDDLLKLREAEEKWEKIRDFLFVMLNHQDIDNADLAFEEIRIYLENDDESEIGPAAGRLLFYLEELLHTEKISLSNIF